MVENEVRGEVLYDDGKHQFVWLGWDEEEDDGIVNVNQYLIVHDGVGTLLDPGGIHVFSRVVTNIARYIDLERVENIFFSHQDPDVCSGLSLWMGVTPAKVHVSKLWLRFLPHFGTVDLNRLVGIDDRGGRIPWRDGSSLRVIPAHFLHSVGNHTVFDPVSRILFTGDLGAAVFSRGERFAWVDDFAAHARRMEGFHKRYMASQTACRTWVRQARSADPAILAPQHGAMFRGKDVERFLSWLEDLRCGIDLLDGQGAVDVR